MAGVCLGGRLIRAIGLTVFVGARSTSSATPPTSRTSPFETFRSASAYSAVVLMAAKDPPYATGSLEPDAGPSSVVPAAADPLEPDAASWPRSRAEAETASVTDDGDSAIDSLATSTTSLRDELILQLREHGRQYQGYMEAKYVLPMDEQEIERLDFQHHIVWLTLNKEPNFAPIKSVNRALDVGCGTGIWAIDFADAHPESEVLGVDLAPVQPENVPPNLSFEVDDLEKDWTFSRNFDFIHCQLMIGAFQDWSRFCRQAFENLEDGGYLEVHDIDFVIKCDDGSLPTNSALVRWHNYMHDAASKAGFPLDAISHVPAMMENAGFTDIVATPIKWPINTWPKDPRFKEIGRWVMENFIWGCESMSLALFTRALGWSADEVRVFMASVRADLRNRRLHAYWNFWVIYGRRPESAVGQIRAHFEEEGKAQLSREENVLRKPSFSIDGTFGEWKRRLRGDRTTSLFGLRPAPS
ncbi:S-adenosyl-L-methionine-dependent methyltransferase [Lojkania enalia]|uniref:S-adenosyl-L-methionine-dependent methyltransferase n=1 Tax=Lojkania enalia TaxID=147567 RepID=A0A9P4K3F0_9PLEO|nr:S-adenosyl-L-methionine-dependent methyltransferase [Didymosphaeria enalia]